MCICGPSRMIDAQLAAVAVAHASVAASAELLRFAREGACAFGGIFAFNLEPEAISQLADALKLAIEIELPAADMRMDDQNNGGDADAEGREMLGQMHAACVRFVKAWA